MSNESIIKVIVAIVGIISVAILVAGFMWAKKNKTEKKKSRRVKASLLSLALVAIFIANFAILRYNVVIGQYFEKAGRDKEKIEAAQKNSKELTEQIQDEGIVLLENKGQALPLNMSNDKEVNVNVFGQSSVGLTFGGSGSGAADESKNISLEKGLENAGFKLNSDLLNFYKEHAPKKEETNIFSLNGGDYNLSEPATSEFSDELLKGTKNFSDVALVVLSRNGGEGGDLPMNMSEYTGEAEKHYLELSSAEREMIDMVKSMNFEKVIVVINSSNAMELGFLEEEGIDAAIWIGGPGSTGANSVGKVLAGTINPSGRLVDTYAYDVTTSPAYYNAGDFKYTNTAHMVNGWGGEKEAFHTFLNYNEGIYVGYRFYETRFVNNETGKCDEEAYNKTVQYPFGYGLSYTSFKQEILNYKTENGKITVDVKVTNTGDKAGKEVVQVYYTAPYYEGGIEKSHVVLGAFDKTEMLEAGASETLTLEFDVEDMASYDYKNEKAYVLDEGKYVIKLMNNSHEVIDSREYSVNEKVIYNGDNKRTSDEVSATNQFDYANGDLKYVSRADWEGTLPTERTQDKEASKELITQIETPIIENNEEDKEIVFANHGLKLEDMIGADYDDPRWEQLLEQISLKEMAKLIGFGGYATQEVRSVDKPLTSDLDGPAGINGLVSGVSGVQYNSEVVIASTWNKDLAYKMGEYFGDEAIANEVAGVYAPAVNIHRTPFSGRNFEYYSEDPLLSGEMGSKVVSGAKSKGVYCYVKHFALNDQETNRSGVCTWSNEQAIREIYLKAFEIPVKEGKTTAIMSSFNRIGTVWAGGNTNLLNTVLRDEWGFNGMVITDYFGAGHMNQDQAIRAGNDLMLSTMGGEPTTLSTETNTGKQAMRQATKNILYTVANSVGMEIDKGGVASWVFLLAFANIALLGLVAFGFNRTMKGKKKKEIA